MPEKKTLEYVVILVVVAVVILSFYLWISADCCSDPELANQSLRNLFAQLPICGDDLCESIEDCSNCPEDCGECPDERIVAKLCENITSDNQFLSSCSSNGETIYVINRIVGEGGRLTYYDSEGNFIEDAIREDVPIFETNSGKLVHCITGSGEECYHNNCYLISC